MLVDSHAHIYAEYYDDIAGVLEQAKQSGVSKIINCATCIDNFKEIIDLSHKYSLYYALGIHPEDVDSFSNDTKKELERWIEENINDKKICCYR